MKSPTERHGLWMLWTLPYGVAVAGALPVVWVCRQHAQMMTEGTLWSLQFGIPLLVAYPILHWLLRASNLSAQLFLSVGATFVTALLVGFAASCQLLAQLPLKP